MTLFYGWIVVALAFLNLLVSLGIRFTYSVFFVSLTKEFSWDRASTSGVFSISLLLFAFIGPFLGYFLDRSGAHTLQAPGTIVWSWLSDRVGRVRAFAFGSLCVVAALALLIALEVNVSGLFAWGFALAFGLGG